MTVAAPAAASPVADTDVSATATVEADTTGTEGDASLGRAATLITVATLVASMGNYGVNLVAARWLSPAAFGDASLVVTLMLAATAATVAFQLVTAQQISIADDDARRAHRRSALRRSFRLGLVGAAILAAAAPWLRDASSSASALPLVLLAVSLPFALAQSVERGVLQGRLAFRPLAATLLVEAAARSVVTVTLLAAGAGAAGVAIGVLVSFVASWAWGRTAVLRCERGTVVGSSARPAAPTTAASAVARGTATRLVGQVLVNNGDVVLAKMLFDADAAGVYAVVALVGRAVFFLSWSVATAAFPHAAREGA
ncbi:MAG: oligosaccharide flippase family protein, partial [Ilumatobacter sp.]